MRVGGRRSARRRGRAVAAPAPGRPVAEGVGRAHLRHPRPLARGAHRLERAGLARRRWRSSPSARRSAPRPRPTGTSTSPSPCCWPRSSARWSRWSSACPRCACAASTSPSPRSRSRWPPRRTSSTHRFFDWVPTDRVERPPLLGRISIDSPTAHLLRVPRRAGARGAGPPWHPPQPHRTGAHRPPGERAAAQSYGISAVRAKLTAFAISGALAAFAGCLFVHHQQAFGEGPYEPGQNLAVFTMVVIGGVGSVPGALLGALYLRGHPVVPADRLRSRWRRAPACCRRCSSSPAGSAACSTSCATPGCARSPGATASWPCRRWSPTASDHRPRPPTATSPARVRLEEPDLAAAPVLAADR